MTIMIQKIYMMLFIGNALLKELSTRWVSSGLNELTIDYIVIKYE